MLVRCLFIPFAYRCVFCPLRNILNFQRRKNTYYLKYLENVVQLYPCTYFIKTLLNHYVYPLSRSKSDIMTNSYV